MYVTFAVIQTIETSLLGARPDALRVNGLPGTATSGVAFIVVIWVEGLPGSTIGPGSAGAPSCAGGVSGVGAAVAAPCRRSSTPAATVPVIASLCLRRALAIVVLLMVFSFAPRALSGYLEVVFVPGRVGRMFRV